MISAEDECIGEVIHKGQERKQSPTRILIVDDDSSVRELLEFFLSREAEITLAGNGRAALEKMEDQNFDLIISDVDMPITNGIDFFLRLHAEDENVNRKFLFCTGYINDELREVCDRYQVRFCLKPIDVLSVQEIVRQMVELTFV